MQQKEKKGIEHKHLCKFLKAEVHTSCSTCQYLLPVSVYNPVRHLNPLSGSRPVNYQIWSNPGPSPVSVLTSEPSLYKKFAQTNLDSPKHKAMDLQNPRENLSMISSCHERAVDTIGLACTSFGHLMLLGVTESSTSNSTSDIIC